VLDNVDFNFVLTTHNQGTTTSKHCQLCNDIETNLPVRTASAAMPAARTHQLNNSATTQAGWWAYSQREINIHSNTHEHTPPKIALIGPIRRLDLIVLLDLIGLTYLIWIFDYNLSFQL
jgi:hypothetical protein